MIIMLLTAWNAFSLHWEFNVAILGGLTCLLLTGAGIHSIDGRRAESEASRAASRARLRGKV